MYSLRLLNRAKPVQQARLISNFPTLRDAKPTNATPIVEEPTPKPVSANPSVMGPRMVTPRNIDKKILVWMKYYKSVEEVPDQVRYEALDKAQNWFRIRCANWMLLGTAVTTFLVVYAGKKRAEKGESVDQMNLDWHNKVNAEYQSSLANAQVEKKE